MDSSTAAGWYNQTTLHPIGILAMLALAIATFVVPRRYVLVPMLVLVRFVSPAQRVVIATLDFNFLRVMILTVWARLFFRGEVNGFRWKTMDTLIVAWIISATTIASLLHATFPAFVNRLGTMYDAVGLYFLFRVVVRGWDDIRVFARAAAVVSVPVAVAFLVEKSTGRNLFAIFGGVPEITGVRNGRVRCQGPFSHPILAGCFWAALMPLIAALWFYARSNRVLTVVGLAGSMVVVITCASATPIGGVIFGAAAAALFPLRNCMSWIRWGGLIGLVGLQLIMTNPIWHLLARANLVSGSTGWYRFKLIDEFLGHFGEWWLMGTEGYSSWWAGGFEAITNEYALEGIEGGLLTLVLFLAIIAMAFVGAGRAGRTAIALRERRRQTMGAAHRRRVRFNPDEAMAWALGVSLFVHCVVFIGVSYFGQTIMVWYLTLGFIGSMTSVRRRPAPAAASTARRRPARARRRRRAASRGASPVPAFGT